MIFFFLILNKFEMLHLSMEKKSLYKKHTNKKKFKNFMLGEVSEFHLFFHLFYKNQRDKKE